MNGTAFDTDLGQVTALPSGHDARVVGDESVIVVDCSSTSNYAKAWWSRQVEHQRIGAPGRRCQLPVGDRRETRRPKPGRAETHAPG